MASTFAPREMAKSESAWMLAWKKLSKHKLAMASLVVLIALIFLALFAPYIAPYSPTTQDRANFFHPPSAKYWLGTDDLGRDVLSRLIYGSRVSLLVGFISALSSVLIGTILGTLAGFFSAKPLRFFVGPLNTMAGGWRFPFVLWRVLSWVLYYGFLYLAVYIAWALAGESVQKGLNEAWTGSRILSGLGLSSVGLGALFAAIWGFRGRFGLDIDIIISRIIDFMLTLPGLPILLVLSALLRDPRSGFGKWTQNVLGEGSSVFIIIFILVIFGWITTARLVRAAILSLREQDFSTAATALGVSQWRIMFRHLVPNAITPVIVQGTLQVATSILAEAGLSFLGFGIQPPVSTWGNMLNNAQNYIFFAPWLAFPPGIMIVITVLSINFLGDGLRDALDPRRRPD